MPPTTLEHNVLSTAHAAGGYSQWISAKSVKLRRTGPVKYTRFVRLSSFDLAVHEAFDRLASLESNWDAEGAYPVEPAIIDTAKELISALPRRLKRRSLTPAVVPMRKGNLQFEWHKGERTLELEIEDPRTIHYLKWDPTLSVEEEDIVSIADAKTVSELLEWFVRG